MSLRKLVCAAAVVVCMGFAANAADISSNALGIRGLFSSGAGVELNYQTTALLGPRVEIGASWDFDANYIGVGAYWHFLHSNITSGLNWYVGAGPYVSIADNYFGVGGQVPVGIEFNFNSVGVPILLSLDARPGLSVLEAVDFIWDVGLGIRFTF
jgi:hypothetical protein